MKRGLLAAVVRGVSGAQPRWAAPPPGRDQQCIYFANHTSHLDAIVLWASLPPELRERARPVAAKDYWDKSAVRRYLAAQVFHAVLIDRTKVTVHNNPIQMMIEAMGQGTSLIIFPEGRRNEGEEMVPFKSGLYHLAQHKPNAAFIPVYIENLNRILPRGEFLPVPLLSTITFGAPLSRLEKESKPAFLERAQKAVADLKPHT